MGKGHVKVTSDLLTRIYRLPRDEMLREPKVPVASDADVQALTQSDELEVVWNWSPWMVLQGKV